MIQLLAILVMCMTPGSVVAQGVDWYHSDGAAIKYSATTEQSGLASEWSLSIQKSPGTERTVHYRDGKPVATWLRSLDSSGLVSREAVEEDGRIVEERLFGPGQLLSLERFFMPDGSVEETRYIHDDGRLILSTQFKNGDETGARLYLYYPDGRLAGVRDQTADMILPTGTERPKSGQTLSWTSTPQGLILSIYDNQGRLAGSRTYEGAVLISMEDRIWRDGRLASINTEQPEDGTRLILSYDQTGRLESRLEIKDGETSALYEFDYDQDDKLVSEHRETHGRLEVIEYTYGSDGVLLSEAHLLNGLLALTRIYAEQNEMLEEYYDKGVLFARILYKDGRKVRETILSGGKVVRERTF